MASPSPRRIKQEPSPRTPSSAQDPQSSGNESSRNPRASTISSQSQTLIDEPFQLDNDELFKGATADQLKASKDSLWDLLTEIQAIIHHVPGPSTQRWLGAIDRIRNEDEEPITKIGVRGATGAGKTTTINAICDIPSMMPTSGTESTTAVVTEIYHSGGSDPAFRLEVEFISVEEWTKVISGNKALLDNEEDVGGRESADPEAATASRLLATVYPHMNAQEIRNTSVEALLASPGLSPLGAVQRYSATDAEGFRDQLQKFVDNGEASMISQRSGSDEKTEANMELWPLVRVIRAYVPAAVLSTGAVIIDMPGSQDCNIGRESKASSWTRHCTEQFIFAQSTRAISDKSASDLLDPRQWRELRMDGMATGACLTFIATKKDHINISDTAHSVTRGNDASLKSSFESMIANVTKLAKHEASLTTQAKKLSDKKQALESQLAELDAGIKLLDKAKERYQQGGELFAEDFIQAPSTQAGAKRKAGSKPGTPRKRTKGPMNKFVRAKAEDKPVLEKEQDESQVVGTAAARGSPLTEVQIDAMLKKKTAAIQARRPKIQEAIDQVAKLTPELEDAKKAAYAARDLLYYQAMEIRDQQIAGRIRQKFALMSVQAIEDARGDEDGRISLEQGGAQGESTKLAMDLPVICASATAYFALEHGTEVDTIPPGFEDIETTGIPQIRRHIIDLTERRRVRAYRASLHKMTQLVVSLHLWSLDAFVRGGEDDGEKRWLAFHLQILEARLEAVLRAAVNEANDLLEAVYTHFADTVVFANDKAPKICAEWSDPAKSGGRGIRWNTYRAITRCHGDFKAYSFNNDLADPAMKYVERIWTDTFDTSVPQVLRAILPEVTKVLAAFHLEVNSAAQRLDLRRHPLLQTLEGSIDNAAAVLGDGIIRALDVFSQKQRGLQSNLAEKIQRRMRTTYDNCASESGKGMFGRITDEMKLQVERLKQTLYKDSLEEISNEIKEAVDSVKKILVDEGEHLFASVSADYRSTLLSDQSSPLSREMRESRKQVSEIVGAAKEAIQDSIVTTDNNVYAALECPDADDDDAHDDESAATDQTEDDTDGLDFDGDSVMGGSTYHGLDEAAGRRS